MYNPLAAASIFFLLSIFQKLLKKVLTRARPVAWSVACSTCWTVLDPQINYRTPPVFSTQGVVTGLARTLVGYDRPGDRRVRPAGKSSDLTYQIIRSCMAGIRIIFLVNGLNKWRFGGSATYLIFPVSESIIHKNSVFWGETW
jgi:hypothetical protein